MAREARRLREQRPTVADFLAVIDAHERATAGSASSPRYTLLAALTALLASDQATASRLIDEALSRGERQFSTSQGTVWELLDRDRKSGTGVFDTSG